MPLTKTAPASMRRTKRTGTHHIRWSKVRHRGRTRWRWHAIAASTSLTRRIAAAGPNVSSRRQPSGGNVVKHRGCVEAAGAGTPGRHPPASGRPQRSSAGPGRARSAAQAGARQRADAWCRGSIGSPTTSSRVCATKASTKASATAFFDDEALGGEIQLWPALPKRALTAVLAAAAISASASTMKGSEPPNSSTCFFSALPACAATQLADGGRAGERHRGDARIVDQGRHAASLDQERGASSRPGTPASSRVCCNASAHCGTLLACFRMLPLPAISAGRGKSDELPERIVPGHDRQHYAERIVDHVAVAAAAGDRGVGQEAGTRAAQSVRRSRRISRSRLRPRPAACPFRW